MPTTHQTAKATQNRKPPAFQEYAATMMASYQYRLLTLAERGLLYTLRLECWVNRRVPQDPKDLAKYLGVSETELRAALPRLMCFFAIEKEFLYCPELEDYREYLLQVRAKQSTGGKKGAAKAQEQREKLEMLATSNSSGVPKGLTTGSLGKVSQVKSNSGRKEEGLDPHKEWIEEYDGKS